MSKPKRAAREQRENVVSILDSFAVVRAEDEAKHGTYRTKTTILEVFDAMAETEATGEPYRTRLGPAPSDQRVAHLPMRGAPVEPASTPSGEPPTLERSHEFVPGRVYTVFGRDRIVCLRRFFDGPLEMVEVAHEPRCSADSPEPHICRCSVEPLIRTARTLAGTVQPKVTNTLGGVTSPTTCHHDWYTSIVADAGPHAGKVCCTACGGPVDGEAA